MVLSFIISSVAHSSVYRAKFQAPGKYLIVEVLTDSLAHFELSAKGIGPLESAPIEISPMISRKNFPGPTKLNRFGKLGNILETPQMSLEVDPTSLCVTHHDEKRVTLSQICPHNLNAYWKGFTLKRGPIQNLYGLGQEFQNPGQPDGDWTGRVRNFGGIHGNKMVHFNGGDSANTQIPVLYALGRGTLGYALFLDSVYQQRWDFTMDPARVEMYGDQIRWYLVNGNSLPKLRKTYMNLVGHPLVPPRQMFGFWLSEFGYRNWADVEEKLKSLRANHFPIDGFLLDLFWFGGIRWDSDDTPMGRLTWDRESFPDPENHIQTLKRDHGIGLMTIEESYIGKNLPEHADLEQRGFLVREPSGKAAYLTASPWWGRGGMFDWTNPEGGDYWHEQKRLPLIQMGIMGHWLDLGEPEMFHAESVYAKGARQPDVHNIYNMKWVESLHRGYERFTPGLRPFFLSRSGAAGIQRYGTAMWSGDIGANLANLAVHQNVQMHMSLSGIDYYGADIGGFHRGALQGDLNEMYTQWFAYGMLFDLPGRPHTYNVNHDNENSPDRIGDFASNLENLRWRYRLIPYVYSLAHRAHSDGEPVFAPPVYYFQADPNLRVIGRQKMLGEGLMAAVASKHGQTETSIYLPKGTWFDFYSGKKLVSEGQWFHEISLYPEGKLRLPLFAREGALIPLMPVDEQTMNSFGRRLDGSRRDELWVKIYAATSATSFELAEDDGVSTQYRTRGPAKTRITQEKTDDAIRIIIEATQGQYEGQVKQRNHWLEVNHSDEIQRVELNGETVPALPSLSSWEATETGWYREGDLTRIKTGTRSIVMSKEVSLIYKPTRLSARPKS